MRSISNPALHTKGAATFDKVSKNTLNYHEYGTYTLNENVYDFFQKRIFTYGKNNLCIYKSDHSLLHKFDFESSYMSYPIVLNHIHLCGSDTYNCTFIIKTETCFEIHYKINGANKDYEIQTTYIKN